MKPTIAWMGGCRPRPLSEVKGDERKKITELFRENCRIYLDFWGDLPHDARQRFWRWARYDAHATFRA